MERVPEEKLKMIEKNKTSHLIHRPEPNVNQLYNLATDFPVYYLQILIIIILIKNKNKKKNEFH